jgi:exodeoxyribonuclease VIII
MTEAIHALDELDHEYHDDTEYIGSTSLRLFARDPRQYHAERTMGIERKPSEALNLGKLVHAMVLEPDTVPSRYIKAPNVDRRTAKGKIEHAAAVTAAEIHGAELVKADLWETAQGMAESFDSSEAGRVFHRLNKGVAESSIRWVDEKAGVKCKCRPDYLAQGKSGLVCIDLKTTRDVFDFETSARKYGYHRQQAFYQRGLRALTGEHVRFLFAVIDKRPPYITALFEFDEEAIIAADHAIERDLANLAEYQSGRREWPDITTGIHTLTVPEWELNRLFEGE